MLRCYILDFYATFAILVILVVLLLIACTVYFTAKIIIKIVNDLKRRNGELAILNIADILNKHLQENTNIDIEEVLKITPLPKKMILTKEENDILIKYRKLIYSVSAGRFKLENNF